MFSLFGTPFDEHFISGGCVGCPERGCDVETDVCAGCRWLVEMDPDAKLPFVRCRPKPRPIVVQT
jgi:hypothetical protein